VQERRATSVFPGRTLSLSLQFTPGLVLMTALGWVGRFLSGSQLPEMSSPFLALHCPNSEWGCDSPFW
jgi:hypothetical protein